MPLSPFLQATEKWASSITNTVSNMHELKQNCATVSHIQKQILSCFNVF